MGKTKTAFVGGADDQPKKPSYDKAAKAAKRAKASESEVKAASEPVVEEKPVTRPGLVKKAARGKKYMEIKSKVDKNRHYLLSEAIKLVKDTSYSKFDGTVELTLIVKKTGLSASVTLPHPFGKAKKVVVADEATIEALKAGKINFDVLLSTPEMMGKLVPFAKLLGPRGLMPNPKNGTLIKSVEDAKKFSTAATVIKTEKEQPVIHATVGKVSQKETEIEANIKTILEAIGSVQIARAFLKPTMGVSVRLSL